MFPDGPYSPIKIHLTFAEQVALLQSRNMVVSDTRAAEEALRRAGYYRLAGYWHPLRVAGSDAFVSGSTFDLVLEICDFDRRLRLLVLDAVERIEVGLRVDIAYLLGKKHRLAHEQHAYLDGNFCSKVDLKTGLTGYQTWSKKLRDTIAKSNEEFVTHHQQKYGGRMPIWVVTELWDFGLMSRFFSGMKFRDQCRIAERYAAGDGTTLSSWLRSINYVRNVSAHHARLWNRNIVDRAKLPKTQPHHLLHHLEGRTHSQTRIYALLCLLQYLVRTICPTDGWHHALRKLTQQFPNTPLLDLRQAGFPPDWEQEQIWR